MNIIPKIGYVPVSNTTKVVKDTPAGLFSLTCVAAGTVTAYDSATGATGNVLYTGTLAPGQIALWGAHGLAANNGLVVVCTGTFNVAYT